MHAASSSATAENEETNLFPAPPGACHCACEGDHCRALSDAVQALDAAALGRIVPSFAKHCPDKWTSAGECALSMVVRICVGKLEQDDADLSAAQCVEALTGRFGRVNPLGHFRAVPPPFFVAYAADAAVRRPRLWAALLAAVSSQTLSFSEEEAVGLVVAQERLLAEAGLGDTTPGTTTLHTLQALFWDDPDRPIFNPCIAKFRMDRLTLAAADGEENDATQQRQRRQKLEGDLLMLLLHRLVLMERRTVHQCARAHFARTEASVDLVRLLLQKFVGVDAVHASTAIDYLTHRQHITPLRFWAACVGYSDDATRSTGVGALLHAAADIYHGDTARRLAVGLALQARVGADSPLARLEPLLLRDYVLRHACPSVPDAADEDDATRYAGELRRVLWIDERVRFVPTTYGVFIPSSQRALVRLFHDVARKLTPLTPRLRAEFRFLAWLCADGAAELAVLRRRRSKSRWLYRVPLSGEVYLRGFRRWSGILRKCMLHRLAVSDGLPIRLC